MSEIRGWDYASLTCVEGDSQSNPWNTHFSVTWGCLGFLKIPVWIFSASAGLLVEMQMWEPKAKEWVYEEEPTAQARSVLCVDWYWSSWWFVNWPTPISHPYEWVLHLSAEKALMLHPPCLLRSVLHSASLVQRKRVNGPKGMFYLLVTHITKMHTWTAFYFSFPMSCEINTHKYVYTNGPEKQLVHQIKKGTLGSARPSVQLDPLYL